MRRTRFPFSRSNRRGWIQFVSLTVCYALVSPSLAAMILWLALMALQPLVGQAGTAAASAGQTSSTREVLGVQRITLRPGGIQPGSIERPQGRFLLVVYNKTRLEDITLRLNRETGNAVREARLAQRKSRWRDIVDLPPGRYVLSVVERPGWSCRITITGR